jgi:hypothetical protein
LLPTYPQDRVARRRGGESSIIENESPSYAYRLVSVWRRGRENSYNSSSSSSSSSISIMKRRKGKIKEKRGRKSF